MRVINDLETIEIPPVRTVLTIGNFDGVHLGHREIFRRVVCKAQEIGGTSVVITFEPHPLRFLAPRKAPLRLNTPEEKIRLLAASCIDILVVLSFNRQLAELPAEDFVRNILINKLGVKHMIVGYDYAFGKGRRGNTDFLEHQSQKYNFTLEVLEPIRAQQQAHSSTMIRTALREGNVAEAIKILGRNFTLDGLVVHGAGRGRKLGFPTANLSTEKEILPRYGVYAVKVKWRGSYYDAVINVGRRPTFDDGPPTLEIHLIDFTGDLYGQRLRIYFVERLRDEQRFATKEELQSAVMKDILAARRVLAHAQVVEYREYLDCGFTHGKD